MADVTAIKLVRPVRLDSSTAAAAAETKSKCEIIKKIAKNFETKISKICSMVFA